jgi:hypothetical protein
MLVEMTIGEELFAYFVERIDADFGMGFEFKKCPDCVHEIDDAVYHVHYDPARRLSTCDCKGGTCHGHCKHPEAIVALIHSGKLPVPAPNATTRPRTHRVCRRCLFFLLPCSLGAKLL